MIILSETIRKFHIFGIYRDENTLFALLHYLQQNLRPQRAKLIPVEIYREGWKKSPPPPPETEGVNKLKQAICSEIDLVVEAGTAVESSNNDNSQKIEVLRMKLADFELETDQLLLQLAGDEDIK